ncbi:MAG: hypothetical protein ABIR68_02410 [Ilumatobacteraceae bacterium]
MNTDTVAPQAGDLILVEEPKGDPVARLIRATTRSPFSHAIVALGNDEFAECHTGDHVISAFRRNRFEHRIMTKYMRVRVLRPLNMIEADAERVDDMRQRLLAHIHELQHGPLWLERAHPSAADDAPAPRPQAAHLQRPHGQEPHERHRHQTSTKQIAFALADGLGRAVIQRKITDRSEGPGAQVEHVSTSGRTPSRGGRLMRAIIVSTSTKGQERVYCSEFAYRLLTWAGGGDFIDVAELRRRLDALFGLHHIPSTPDEPREHVAGALPRYDDRDRDTFRGQGRQKLRSVAGMFQYSGWIVKYVARPPDESHHGQISVADFVTPADLERSGSFHPVAERRRGELEWLPLPAFQAHDGRP